MVTRSSKSDYQSLLSLADKARRNGFSQQPMNSLAANRKPAATASKEKKPDPRAVQAFIIKKQREEMEKLEAMKRQKQHLLELRGQNRKSAKAAKMMASRTKDNDFSRIVLNDDEIREKCMIEEKLRKQRTEN
ncbi:protein SPT2-like protein [Leptotrombidium deliense]|uniref:Protein SPT2-like protein n=1 Tax=Leptotrombidium deliense TaxID=299467 RepID=A0A443SD63_9ACAR|nr:protein SPT2-like protein [Leptotrombidium deliense]